MRITGGEARGRRLFATRDEQMRPTTDTVRRTLFDILGDRVHGVRVLDLFAGAGTLGIEALSRGAQHATFIERDRNACAIIDRNLTAAGYAASATVMRAEVLKALARGPGSGADLVFVDPPYGAGLRFVARVLQALLEGSWVRPEGTVVVEADAGEIELPVGLSEIRTRRFGRTQILIAVHDAGPDNSHLSGDV